MGWIENHGGYQGDLQSSVFKCTKINTRRLKTEEWCGFITHVSGDPHIKVTMSRANGQQTFCLHLGRERNIETRRGMLQIKGVGVNPFNTRSGERFNWKVDKIMFPLLTSSWPVVTIFNVYLTGYWDTFPTGVPHSGPMLRFQSTGQASSPTGAAICVAGSLLLPKPWDSLVFTQCETAVVFLENPVRLDPHSPPGLLTGLKQLHDSQRRADHCSGFPWNNDTSQQFPSSFLKVRTIFKLSFLYLLFLGIISLESIGL